MTDEERTPEEIETMMELFATAKYRITVRVLPWWGKDQGHISTSDKAEHEDLIRHFVHQLNLEDAVRGILEHYTEYSLNALQAMLSGETREDEELDLSVVLPTPEKLQ